MLNGLYLHIKAICLKKRNLGKLCIISVLLVSFIIGGCSQSSYPHVEHRHIEGGFDQPIDISEQEQAFSFLVVNDIHFGRSDSGVFWAFDTFWTWLDSYQTNADLQIDFAVNLGDFTEDSQQQEYIRYVAFMDEFDDRNIPIHTVAGNHDIRNLGRLFFSTYVNQDFFRRFSHKGLSFYLLDTGNRSLGKDQLQELKEHIQSDTNIKVFCSHVPVYGSPTLIYFALADTQERMEIISTMADEQVGLYLSGHHHSGDLSYSFTDTSSEFICGAFHGRDSFFETTLPRWYIGTFDPVEHTITLLKYTAEKDNSVSEQRIAVFAMPVN